MATSLREALSYGAAILPPNMALNLFYQHDDLVRRLLATIIATPVEGIAKVRYQLPGPLGGLSLRTTALRSPAAYLANHFIDGPQAEVIAARLGKPLRQSLAPTNAIASCKQQLAEIGVIVTARDTVTYLPEIKALL